MDGAVTGQGTLSETETRKRRDILDGARSVFFDKGFDGASMDEVARAGGVSKATVYAHFQSKEGLFRALIATDKVRSAEQLFDVDPEDPDIAGLLYRIGISFMTMMVEPEHIRLVRTVIGSAERFPQIGQAFFESGPTAGAHRLADLLAQQERLGRLRMADKLMAAHQFFNLCHGSIVKELLFGAGPSPAQEILEVTVADAVRVFLAAYGTSGARP